MVDQKRQEAGRLGGLAAAQKRKENAPPNLIYTQAELDEQLAAVWDEAIRAATDYFPPDIGNDNKLIRFMQAAKSQALRKQVIDDK